MPLNSAGALRSIWPNRRQRRQRLKSQRKIFKSTLLKYLLPHVHTISKNDADKDIILSGVLKNILNIWGVILYKRGNKNSGKKVRKLMTKHIKNKGFGLIRRVCVIL